VSETLRVAVFTNTFVPDVNGVANAVDMFRTELMRRGHLVYVFAPAPRKEDPLADDPHVIRFPSLRIFDLDYHAAFPVSRHARRALRDVEFDIVHTHHPIWVGVWGASYARRRNIPLVTTIHTHYELFARFVPLPEGWVRRYLRRSVRRYCNACHLVTTPGASTARHLRRLGVERPTMVLPNGLPLARFEEATGDEVRARYGLTGKFVMGYLGRLSPEKQVHVVIQVAARVFAQRPEAHLLVVGDGPARGELEALTRSLGIQQQVTFAGTINHSEVHKYHAAFDVLLSASRGDTMPLAYAETMAAGTPVVATVGFGAIDMIADGVNGFLISRIHATDQMTELVLKLASDRRLREKLSRQAREYSKRWRVDIATDRLLYVYDVTRRLARGEPVELGAPVEWPGVARARADRRRKE